MRILSKINTSSLRQWTCIRTRLPAFEAYVGVSIYLSLKEFEELTQ
jgi:hypothetical protein